MAPTTEPIINAYWKGNGIYLVRRDQNGKRVVQQQRAEHCVFLGGDAPEEALRMLRDSRYCVGIIREVGWWRTKWRYERMDPGAPPQHVRVARFLEDELKVKTYEADVGPVRRFMTDTECGTIKPRACYLDIETDSRVPFSRQRKEARVLCWVLVSEDGARVDAGILDAETDQAERALLLSLWQALEPYDQVRGWNLDRFDRPMVEERSKLYRLAFESRQWLWLDHMVLYKRMNAHAAKSGAEKQSMKLDSIGKSLGLGGKTEGVDGSMSYEMWSDPSTRGKLLDYCYRDTDLMRLIEERTGYIELFQTLVDATDVLPDTRGISPIGQVEGFLFRLGKERSMHFRTMFEFDTYERFDGAFVMQPKWKGIARNVQVADFAGMYPSIITTWNLSPETYRPDVVLKESTEGRPSYLMHVPLKEYPRPEGHCEVPGLKHVFANEPKGILPIAVDTLGELRAKWSKLKASLPPGTPEWNDADRKADAYKIARNSFYGVTGSPMSRFFLREVAESTSQSGVWLAKQTFRFFEEHGAFVGYGDTDSGMVTGLSEEEFGRVVNLCNTELYPRLLAEMGCARNTILLDFEKGFERIVFTAKKKYVGKYSHYKGKRALADSEPEVKGLEWKRGDAARMTRELQGEVIALLMAGTDPPEAEEFVPIVERWQQRVLEGPLGIGDVKISKTLNKALTSYAIKIKKDGTAAKSPPHVRVARELKKRGEDVGEGTKIDYFVLDEEKDLVVPASDWKGECDRHYLWENTIYPATFRLLSAAYPSFDWKRWAVTRPRKVALVQRRAASAAAKRRKTKEAAAQADLFGGCHDGNEGKTNATTKRVSKTKTKPTRGDGTGWSAYDNESPQG